MDVELSLIRSICSCRRANELTISEGYRRFLLAYTTIMSNFMIALIRFFRFFPWDRLMLRTVNYFRFRVCRIELQDSRFVWRVMLWAEKPCTVVLLIRSWRESRTSGKLNLLSNKLLYCQGKSVRGLASHTPRIELGLPHSLT